MITRRARDFVPGSWDSLRGRIKERRASKGHVGERMRGGGAYEIGKRAHEKSEGARGNSEGAYERGEGAYERGGRAYERCRRAHERGKGACEGCEEAHKSGKDEGGEGAPRAKEMWERMREVRKRVSLRERGDREDRCSPLTQFISLLQRHPHDGLFSLGCLGIVQEKHQDAQRFFIPLHAS